MERDNTPPTLNEKDNLYLLSFTDTSDRLDILLLEIRHLQQSIIDSLHTPTLYLPLRFEEKLIFGGWVELTHWEHYDVATIASRSIVRYPDQHETLREYYHKDHSDDDKKKRSKCLESFTKTFIDELSTYTINNNNNNNSNEESNHQADNKNDNNVDYLQQWYEVRCNLCERIGEVLASDLWGRGERRNYYALCQLQLLKQQIFKDKVTLYKNAKRANILCLTSVKRQLDRPAFMILKRGILFRVERYISILRTHQQSFSKSLDFGLLRYPRPSIERRREIGIFNDFLANRTRDIQHDMLHLLNTVLDDKEAIQKKNTPNIMHGWSQFSKVNSEQLFDDVSRDNINDYKKQTYQDVSYIDSSIWSPDRPDLQSLIAREVAKTLMRSHLANLNRSYLSNSNNLFSTLVVELSRILVNYLEDIEKLKPIHDNHNKLLRIILQDVLAISIKGSAYVYALYLEIIGEGLENQLKSQTGVRLDITYDLISGVSSYEQHYLWYFRLQLSSAWLKAILDNQATHLDHIIFKGTEQVSDHLLDFLDENNPHVRATVGEHWRTLCKKLKKVLEKSSLLKKVKKWRSKRRTDTWIEEHCNDASKKKTGKSGKKEYHRSIMPLDIRIQNYLFRQLIHQKRQKNCKQQAYKLLHNVANTDLLTQSKDAYGLNSTWSSIPHIDQKDKTIEESHYYHPPYFFNYLYDIPYQASLLRSMDLLKGKWCGKDNYWQTFVKQTHEDIVLGRDIFSFGLEFYTWRRDSPRDRLLTCINLLVFCLPSFLNISQRIENNDNNPRIKALITFCKKLSKDIIIWLHNKELEDHELENSDKLSSLSNLDTPIADIVEYINKRNHRSIQKHNTKNKGGDLEKNAFIYKQGAVQLIAASSDKQLLDTKNMRRLEQLCGYKLKHLLKILNNTLFNINNDNEWDFNEITEKSKYPTEEDVSHIIDNIMQLGNLKNYLQIRDEKFCDNSTQGNTTLSSDHYFYELLLQAFGDSKTWHKKDDNNKFTWEMPKELQPVMVSRLSATSYYEGASTKHIEKSFDEKIEQPTNALSLNELLANQTGYWSANVNDKHPYAKTAYTNTIGRYDIIGFTPVHLPCKCSVARFPHKDNNTNQMWKERFVTHFARREIALPLNIYGHTVAIDQQSGDHCDFFAEDYKVLTILSISLQRRAMRLNLAFRLLHAIKVLHNNNNNHENIDADHKEVFANSSVEYRLQEMIKTASDNKENASKDDKTDLVIKGLLTDGWGDLVLVFMYKHEKNSKDNAEQQQLHEKLLTKQGQFLEHFFELQNTLYEDFMVDRTEMIYTPACFDAIMQHNNECANDEENKQKTCTAYRFYLLIRFQEDRKLERLIENFTKAIHKKSQAGEKPIWMNNIDVFDMPGMYDVRIYFKVNYKLFIESKNDNYQDNNDDDYSKEDYAKPFYYQLLKWLEKINENDKEWFWYRNLLSVVDKFETGIERLNKDEHHPKNYGESL